MKRIYLSIDRVEGDWIICENEWRKIEKITLSQMNGKPREGDVIYWNGQVYCIDEQETETRRQATLALQKQIRKSRG